MTYLAGAAILLLNFWRVSHRHALLRRREDGAGAAPWPEEALSRGLPLPPAIRAAWTQSFTPATTEQVEHARRAIRVAWLLGLAWGIPGLLVSVFLDRALLRIYGSDPAFGVGAALGLLIAMLWVARLADALAGPQINGRLLIACLLGITAGTAVFVALWLITS